MLTVTGNLHDPFGPTVSCDLRRFATDTTQVVYHERSDVNLMLAQRLFEEARGEIESHYEKAFGAKFDNFNLGDRVSWVRAAFYSSAAFRAGVQELKLTEVLEKHPYHFNLPWWNELTLAEHSARINAGGLSVSLSDSHSIEVQAIRHGACLPVKPIVIAGLVRTLPDQESENGYIVIGVRGGSHYPNVLAFPGGALKYDSAFVRGEKTIADIFLETELSEEFGLNASHLVGHSPKFHSRHDDLLLDGRAALYIFDCRTTCSRNEIVDSWRRNRHTDKQEHKDLLFLPDNEISIRKFLNETYKGRLLNDPTRPDSARFLSHHAALPLALEARMYPNELRRLCRAEPV